MGGKIRCKKCNTILHSEYTHDFKYCKCKKVFIDGGGDYLRYGYPSGKADEWVEIIKDPRKEEGEKDDGVD